MSETAATGGEIAAAAEVSKPTLFRYFPAKEDLVLHRFADHEDEAARVVAGAGGRSPLEALRRHFADGLARRDPVTGLNDDPRVLAFHGLLYGTPSLVARAYAYQGRSEDTPATALVKHDVRMAAVLRRALYWRVRAPANSLVVPDGSYRWRVPVAELERIVADVREEAPPYAVGRERVRTRAVPRRRSWPSCCRTGPGRRAPPTASSTRGSGAR